MHGVGGGCPGPESLWSFLLWRLQNPPRLVPVQPDPGVPALAGWMISRGFFKPLLLCDSVILGSGGSPLGGGMQ